MKKQARRKALAFLEDIAEAERGRREPGQITSSRRVDEAPKVHDAMRMDAVGHLSDPIVPAYIINHLPSLEV